MLLKNGSFTKNIGTEQNFLFFADTKVCIQIRVSIHSKTNWLNIDNTDYSPTACRFHKKLQVSGQHYLVFRLIFDGGTE